MRTKKIIALIFTFIFAVVSVIGCGKSGSETSNKEGGNSETDIEIGYWRSGLGTVWLDAMIAAFEAKYPQYNVYYNESAQPTAVVASYGNDIDTTDLYMCLKDYETSQMEPLNDILNQTVDGENKTIGEKISPSYLELEKDRDGNVYQLTYGGGVLEIVYNKTMFEDAGIKVEPRTTKELSEACDTLYNSGYVPLCHFNPAGYWEFITEAWFEQYNGKDYYMNTFYSPEEPSIDVLKAKDGRYEALKVYESIITSDYVASGSNSKAHTIVQTEFLKNDSAAMMVNGSWMAYEMSSVEGVDNFKTMRTPVISSITDKLTTVKKESELRKVISAIDSVLNGEKELEDYKDGDTYQVEGMSITAADWDYVYAARTTIASNYSGESMYIPNYAVGKEGAKEFIKFMYSDEGYKIYTGELHLTLPLSLSEGELDTSEWSAFEIEQYNILNEATQIATDYIMSKHDIFAVGGAKSFAGYTYINKFCSNNSADKQNADEVWVSVLKLIDNKYEDDWLANIK